jgi:hypothetical protein
MTATERTRIWREARKEQPSPALLVELVQHLVEPYDLVLQQHILRKKARRAGPHVQRRINKARTACLARCARLAEQPGINLDEGAVRHVLGYSSK